MTTLEQYLVEQGTVSADDLDRAQQLAAKTNERLGSVLHSMAVVPGTALADAFSHVHDIPRVRADEWPDRRLDGPDIPLAFLRNRKVFPLAKRDGAVFMAMADPGDQFTLDAVKLATDLKVVPRVAAIEDIEAAIARAESADGPGSDESKPQVEIEAADDIAYLRDLALDTPVVRFVNDLFENALRARATDIHVEPFDGRVSLRIRVDGMLRDLKSPPGDMGKAIVSRIKILAGLNIAERRLPQDGRARLRLDGRQLDLRIATMPTIYGEAIAIRLLDNVRRVLDLGKLGYRETDQALLRRTLDAPHGMIVVTGPTGSGKTTTLATALSILNQTERKILTIEDPIEYELQGVNQTQAKPDIGLTFATALRAFLRHDPDVIMVGEMRDRETAQIGIHAALTGHLVLTTLHTNTAAGAVTRLLDMGVDAYLLASSLNCVVAQRLVRRLCTDCSESHQGRPELPPAALAAAGLGDAGTMEIWHGKGCDRCGGTGYRDRIAIAEILDVNETLRGLIKPGISAPEIEQAARENGMTPMVVDGIGKCRDGLTSPDEVRRVTLEL